MTVDCLVTHAEGQYDNSTEENPDEDLSTKLQFLVQTVCSSFIVCLSDVGDLVALGRVGNLCSIGNFSVQGACQGLVTWVTTGRIW